MLKLSVYGWLEGNGSPSKWAKMAVDSQSMRWLIRGIEPSRMCCYNFRDRVGGVIEDIVSQVLTNAIADGLVDPHIGVQDGTAVRAVASRHRLVNRKTLQQRQEVLDQAIREDEQGKPVEEGAPKWLAKTPDGRKEQQRRFEQAAKVLAEREQVNAARCKSKQLAARNLQVSLSEPEAPLGRDKEKVFCALYTAQFVVEPSSLLIMTYDVFAQATDAGTLPKMAEKTRKVLGHYLDTMIADGVYASLLDLRYCDESGIELIAGGTKKEDEKPIKGKKSKKPPKLDRSQFVWQPEEQTYLCPEGHTLKYHQKDRVSRRDGETLIENRYRCPPEHCMGCPRKLNCVDNPKKGRIIKRLEGQEFLDTHVEKMQTERAKNLYKLRGQVIERAFADIKQHRQGRRLHGRGLMRAKAEIGLMVFAQNFLTIIRLRKKRESDGSGGT